MRTVKWNAFLRGLCGSAVALGMMATGASADVTTERGASIIIFPKVIANGTFNTTIQISNTSNDVVFARCFYVNAQLSNPDEPEHPILNPPLWLETDFEIRLTRQQPTHWDVLRGRPVTPFDTCAPSSSPTCVWVDGVAVDINGLGIDPGAVPPVPPTFVGELKCVEVDASGTPLGGNHLKGEATISGAPEGASEGSAIDVSKYNAIGIEGTQLVGATGNDLQLSNRSGEENGMYDACPAVTFINHFAEGAENPLADKTGFGRRCALDPNELCAEDDDCTENTCTAAANTQCSITGTACTADEDCEENTCEVGGVCSDNASPCHEDEDCTGSAVCLLSGVFTELTVVPCSQDFENQIPSEVTLQFRVYNEFEDVFSASTTVVCWKNTFLSELGNSNAFLASTLGSAVAQTYMTPADTEDGGVLAVLEEYHWDARGNVARAAMNVHTRGDRFFGEGGEEFDRIFLPGSF